MNEWKFGGPLTRAQTLRAEGDRIMAQADELREAMIHAERTGMFPSDAAQRMAVKKHGSAGA